MPAESESSLHCTLYYADWCGHCVSAKSEWNKLKQNIKNIGNEYKGVKINVVKMNDKEADIKEGGGKINGVNIEGFPTIKFGLKLGNNFKEYEYSKERNAETMLKYIKRVCNKMTSFK